MKVSTFITPVLAAATALGVPEVIVYEPYSGHVVRIIEIPDLAPKEDYQISDVHWDFYTGFWIFLVTRRGTEELRDSSMLGNTYLIKYDLTKNELIWTLNLENTIKTSWKPKKWGGFHSIETDHQGSVYLAGTLSDTDHWGTWSECGIIIRTFFDAQFPMIWWMGWGPRGEVKIGGLAKPRDSARLLTHSNKGLIGHLNLLLDMGEMPARWLDSPYGNVRIHDVQKIMMPPKYTDFVMLLTSPTAGVQIMQNFGWKWMKDDWLHNHHSVQHTYGVLPPPANATAENGYPYETVQVGSNSILLLSRTGTRIFGILRISQR
ncbi:hypothetical protein QBC45DRAFT_450203 [Copromyces sp. CBS 386.78]|nr:hypothetical protein QBC45DRAFT_450203 [Copromyces sp. CBS 386.78]